ncbi:MAG: sigma-70 family RNA polymerase sigma factor [Bryobacteraceae bacterium]|nr:sigma-70 family RNA polymerase sigma factor [Bryobacteraceae bacterium]
MASDDRALVAACLAEEPGAWEALIQKYKRLIYSVPMRYRFSPDDAADIFQAVCIDLYRELPRLREVDALRGWLARVAANKCFHRRQALGREPAELDDQRAVSIESEEDVAETAERLEREQLVREAVDGLETRCRKMIRMLFFEDPPRPYDEVAKSVGLAIGSIGFTRAKCLERLARALKERGL